MQSEVILWGFAVHRTVEGWCSQTYRYEDDAFAAHRAARQTGHECGPIVRIVLPLPTDYPEPSR